MKTHGGRRPGAGRPKGSKARKPLDDLPADIGAGRMPLDVGLRAMRTLEAQGEFEKAGRLAARLARFFSQEFSTTDQPAKPHAEQSILPLWESKPKTPTQPVGKKEQAQIDAAAAGEGTDWGDLLKPERPN